MKSSSLELSTAQQILRPLALLMLGVSIGIAAMFLAGTTLQRPESPAELRGTWITSDTPYQERFLEISRTSLTFGTGPGTSSTVFIKQCVRTDAGPVSTYVVSYTGDDGPANIYLSFDSNEGTLHLKNLTNVTWHKSVS